MDVTNGELSVQFAIMSLLCQLVSRITYVPTAQTVLCRAVSGYPQDGHNPTTPSTRCMSARYQQLPDKHLMGANSMLKIN